MLFESRRSKKLLVRKGKSSDRSGKAPNAGIVLRPEISWSDIILDSETGTSDLLDLPMSRILDPGAIAFLNI